MTSIGQFFKQLGQMYADLTLGKKISFMIFLVIGIAAFVLLAMVAKQPDYRMLYSDLAAEDLNEVVAYLKENRIQYKIDNGGRGIAVSSADYYEARMQLAGAGLPQGGISGFEIFDNKTLGMTNFQQSVNFQRALQGELSRSIQQLSPIESCRVHLVMPKESLFREDQKDTTASVAVKLRKNGRLTEEQVEAIVFLVSGSVEGLDPNHVTVIDSKGKVLSRKREDNIAGPVNSAMLEYKQKVEGGLEHSILSLLAKSLGADKIAAKVSADIDFRQVSLTKEEFDPETQVARSERMVDESADSNENDTAAAPGTDSNMPDEQEIASGSQNSSNTKKRTETINYEISKVISQINEPVGEIKKLSIAVMIDGTYKKNAEGEKSYVERSTEEMNKFTQLVKTAVGYSTERGDKLEVINIAFNSDQAFEQLQGFPSEKKEMIFTIVNHSLIGVGLLLFALFVIRPMIKWLTADPAYETVAELAGMLPSGVAELEQQMLRGPDGMKGSLPPGYEGADVEDDTHDDRMAKLMKRREKIMSDATKDKAAIASILKKWLKEGE